MNPSSPVNWYVQAPSLVLALLSYLLIARFALDLAFGPRGDNVVFRALRRVTGPVVRAVIALVQVAAAMAMRRMMG